jgi:hypothetical protein
MCGTMSLCIDQTISICRAACTMDLRAVQPISFPFVSPIGHCIYLTKSTDKWKWSTKGFVFLVYLNGIIIEIPA